MKPGELDLEYRKYIENLTDEILDFLQNIKKPSNKYSSVNIFINVCTCCLMRILYAALPEEKREEALQMIVDQIKRNFIENDKLNENKND